MSNFEMYNELENRCVDLCDLFTEICEASLSEEEREKYEKRVAYYEQRFNRKKGE